MQLSSEASWNVRRVRAQSRKLCTAATRMDYITPGQKIRGHSGANGSDGWKHAGWDLKDQSLSESSRPELRSLLLTYGELSHATYDNLGLDRTDKKTYGKTLDEDPQELLKYLTSDYRLAATAAASNEPGTGDMYKLPTWIMGPGDDAKLSPLIYALPGKLTSDGKETSGSASWSIFSGIVDYLFNTASSFLVNFIDGTNGGRCLFRMNPKTGRGLEVRGAFFGYVAMSQPAGPDKEVDVALVWRGTQFREEWESNFAADKLSEWQRSPETKTEIITSKPAKKSKKGNKLKSEYTAKEALGLPEKDDEAPKPWHINVHDGFDDLYNRPVTQPDGGPKLSPRQVARKWLMKLMKEYNVTTVTTTGHSLGGGMATISAFGTAKLLDDEWETWPWKEERWKTQKKPKVTLVSFASPRAGNYKFVKEFRRLNIRGLRIVNKGDIVPQVPGLVVQTFTWLFEHLPLPLIGKQAAYDMDSFPVKLISFLYWVISCAIAVVPLIGWNDRWGYFHVGQVLELDPDAGGKDPDRTQVVKDLSAVPRHNLELHLYLLSKLGEKGIYGYTTRNPLLMNKNGDLLKDEDYPAEWWKVKSSQEVAEKRGYVERAGRWVFPGKGDQGQASDTAQNQRVVQALFTGKMGHEPTSDTDKNQHVVQARDQTKVR